MLLKTKGVNEEIKEGIRKYLNSNENSITALQNLRDPAKAVLKWNFIVIQASFKKQEKSQRNNLNYHLKQLEKQEKKPEIGKRKKIIKVREKINEIETKKKKINETKSYFF